MHRTTSFLLAVSLALLSLPWSQAHAMPHPSRMSAYQRAAAEFHVPESVLLSVSYHVSLWEDHGGHPSTSGGYGPMHLTHPNASGTLDVAARLLHEPASTLRLDPAENIRGGAALLARYASRPGRSLPANAADWYSAVARYSGAHGPAVVHFADAVYSTIQRGAARVISSGEVIRLPAQHVLPHRSAAPALRATQSQTTAECPTTLTCQFIPAAYALDSSNPEDYGNYDVAHRVKNKIAIRYIVIHDTEGSYDAAINTFRNPARYASANYVVRSSDGLITQMVKDGNIAWHCGNYYVNMHAIGIEHEGIAIAGATWYSEEMYEASAALVSYLADRYNIPRDRAHILGHDEVPGPDPQGQTTQHWDPGPYWDWQHYMELIDAPLPQPSTDPAAPPISVGSVITVNPTFATNGPDLSYCSTGTTCAPLSAQPANFVYLRTAPSTGAPLIADRALSTSGPGTTHANDWGDKAVTGAQYVVVDSKGPWLAVDYAGIKAWLYNPPDAPVAAPSEGQVITPRTGVVSIKVYGRAYPEPSAYPASIPKPERIIPLQYSVTAGQQYVMTDKVTADYFWSPTMTRHAIVRSKTVYYQITFNHRVAFVKAKDVQVVNTVDSTPTGKR